MLAWLEKKRLDWGLTPLEALSRWPGRLPALLLHSGRFDPRWSRYSVLTTPAATYRFTTDGRSGLSPLPGAALPSSLLDVAGKFVHEPFDDLRSLLAAGGPWIGCIGYDIAGWIEQLPHRATRDRDWPIVELAYCPGLLLHDGLDNAWHACGEWAGGGYPELAALPASLSADDTQWSAHLTGRAFQRRDYEAAVQRVIDFIAAGDVFQVNLAQRFTAELASADPLLPRALFQRLSTISPAWYGAFLELGWVEGNGPQRAIASTSPELFLHVNETGQVLTRPIKGTRPAAAGAEALRDSDKDIAELNMIVDLLRNDLGRVAEYGSVKVAQAREIESHPTVHHGVATITSRLRPGCDIVDLLRAAMPGGSITGAPKVRAMQIIDQLEPVARGPYCGCIGLLSQKETILNIAIRTMLIESHLTRHRVDFHVGGGIVADSVPTKEYQETLDKAAAILATLGLTID